MVFTIGIPLDENSSYLRGSAAAPTEIRKAFHSDSANYWTEDSLNLERHPKLKDDGDLKLPPMPAAFDAITSAVSNRVQQGNKVLCLGGDHSITYPIIRGFAQHYRELTIIHLDAHGDLYDSFNENRFSHACPFARIMEANLASRLIQVGIRTYNSHQREQVARFGVESIEMKDWNDDLRFVIDGPVYLSLDLDALDPAFVPGVSHHEPGGFSTRQVLNIIQQLDCNLVGADIVELNPIRDIHGMTAMVAAKCYKELLARLLMT
ncbi:agmatinase [Chryseolinea sp. T2]|uniref:agmatinase n=1 Tax=Chryseolinea sp. T2 TaxID=3129255 RepID=UPI0030776817